VREQLLSQCHVKRPEGHYWTVGQVVVLAPPQQDFDMPGFESHCTVLLYTLTISHPAVHSLTSLPHPPTALVIHPPPTHQHRRELQVGAFIYHLLYIHDRGACACGAWICQNRCCGLHNRTCPRVGADVHVHSSIYPHR